MQIFKLCFLGFYLNGANSSGKYDDITIKEIQEQITEGLIFSYLARRLQGAIDLSVITPDDERELINEWRTFINVIDESRKLSICADKGLSLLVAYLFEGIQSRVGIELDILSTSGNNS